MGYSENSRIWTLTIFIWGGILKLSDLDSVTIFIWGYSETLRFGVTNNFSFGGGILKLSDLDSLTIFIWGGILKLSDLDSLTIFIWGGGGILKLYIRIGGILEEFGPKFQPLQQAHASQIVSHILRMWRLKRTKLRPEIKKKHYSIPEKKLSREIWKLAALQMKNSFKI